jgi:hypothetical protein
VLPDRGFKHPESEGGWLYTPLKGLRNREDYIDNFELTLMSYPLDSIPCPIGLAADICDTLETIARWRLGFEGGRQYYRYVDENAKNGLPYFYAVTSYDHDFLDGVPYEPNRYNSPSSNFLFTRARSDAQSSDSFTEKKVYVVPNPVTDDTMEPWRLEPWNPGASSRTTPMLRA